MQCSSVVFCFRCKELVLATVRAFFDLVDPETKQVRTNTSGKKNSTTVGLGSQSIINVFVLVHSKPHEEDGRPQPSLCPTSCQDGWRHWPHPHLFLRLDSLELLSIVIEENGTSDDAFSVVYCHCSSRWSWSLEWSEHTATGLQLTKGQVTLLHRRRKTKIWKKET